MLGDSTRGSSVTRAILGLPAEVLYVCGDAAAVELLHHLCTECGDDLQVESRVLLWPKWVQKPRELL